MLRCSSCNRVVAAAGFVCICGALVAHAHEQPYLVPDQPHIHNEAMASTAHQRNIIQSLSTAATATGLPWPSTEPALRFTRRDFAQPQGITWQVVSWQVDWQLPTTRLHSTST